MRNFAVQYNQLWTQHALENFTGRPWAEVKSPQFVPARSLVMQIHHWSAVTPQIYCIAEGMLILMLKIHLNHNIKNFRPHLKLWVLHQHCLHLQSKGLKPFVRNPIFLFRTRSVNKILCHLWPLWFYPLFSFLFPLVFSSLGDDSCSLTFALLGFFPLQGKMASTFFFLYFHLSSCCWALSVFYAVCQASLFWCVLFTPDFQLFVYSG